jgi:chromosome segregation ATPase
MNEDLIYERDRNQKLKASIREQEHYKGEMLEELRKVEDNHEGHSRQIQQMA